MDSVPILVIIPFPALFDLGTVIATCDAVEHVPAAEMAEALGCHARGDSGDLELEDQLANKQQFDAGGKIVSVYETKSGIKFQIVTAPTQFATTVELPEED